MVSLDDGTQTHKITKVPVEELDLWDSTHDAAGRKYGAVSTESEVVVKDQDDTNGSETIKRLA